MLRTALMCKWCSWNYVQTSEISNPMSLMFGDRNCRAQLCVLSFLMIFFSLHVSYNCKHFAEFQLKVIRPLHVHLYMFLKLKTLHFSVLFHCYTCMITFSISLRSVQFTCSTNKIVLCSDSSPGLRRRIPFRLNVSTFFVAFYVVSLSLPFRPYPVRTSCCLHTSTAYLQSFWSCAPNSIWPNEMNKINDKLSMISY